MPEGLDSVRRLERQGSRELEEKESSEQTGKTSNGRSCCCGTKSASEILRIIASVALAAIGLAAIGLGIAALFGVTLPYTFVALLAAELTMEIAGAIYIVAGAVTTLVAALIWPSSPVEVKKEEKLEGSDKPAGSGDADDVPEEDDKENSEQIAARQAAEREAETLRKNQAADALRQQQANTSSSSSSSTTAVPAI